KADQHLAAVGGVALEIRHRWRVRPRKNAARWDSWCNAAAAPARKPPPDLTSCSRPPLLKGDHPEDIAIRDLERSSARQSLRSVKLRVCRSQYAEAAKDGSSGSDTILRLRGSF